MPLIGIMLLVTCNRKERLLKETCLQHWMSNIQTINAYPGGIPGMTGGIPGIIGGTPGIIGGIPLREVI